jgi:uncharacterized protein (TIGR00251 family)
VPAHSPRDASRMPPAPELTIDRRAEGIGFWIHVSPGARKSELGGLHGDALRISVRAAPHKGAANAECVKVLAKALGVPTARIGLAAGAKGRRKRVQVEGESEPLAADLRALASQARVG